MDDLRNPAVAIAFSGWNDAGNAASDLLRHLAATYPGTDLGVIDDERYWDFQQTRPMLHREADGPWIEWPALRMRVVHHPSATWSPCSAPSPTCCGAPSRWSS
ncbi:PAC2 family protein [Tessaracoccus sp. HDW20]|nr:PAC2 family protein [Tessaracoccus coleopterorum]